MAGKSKNGATRLLRLQGETWWFKQDVPAACQAICGKKVWMENLATADVRVAKARRDALEAETKQAFADMRAGRWAKGRELSPSDRGALWRETLIALSLQQRADGRELVRDKSAIETGWSLSSEELEPDQADVAHHAEEAERDSLRGSEKVAFEDARLGRVAVDHHLDDYIKAISALAPATQAGRKGHVLQFKVWCAADKVELARVDRKLAGRYVTQKIDGMHPKTAEAHLSSLRSYWSFLHARGHIVGGDDKGGPWADQRIRVKAKRMERGSREEERPFTAEEVNALLHTPYPAGMNEAHRAQVVDAVTVSLLSGMRMEEILTLWVEEVSDGVFDIQQGKTEAAARKVPIHPALTELVKRRMKGKGPKDWLFHELKAERDPGDTFGKRFHRYRLNVGVDDKREGKRRSLVNFHSARRWFITAARHADQPRETIGDVVGHRADKKDITFGVYTQGASEAQWRACVEAVCLPPTPPHVAP
ncbi:MAG: tyrosine-type recombinase/integrase [Paracoccaceae bacterium]